jgi:hypothetical protein
MEIIKDEETIKRIFKEENYLWLGPEEIKKTFGLLHSYYPLLPRQIKDEWEVYAKRVKTPLSKYGFYRVIGGVRVRIKPTGVKLWRAKLRVGASEIKGFPKNLFVRLNKIGMDRKIIDKPRLHPPISPPAASPPLNVQATIQNDRIVITWDMYPPKLFTIYNSYKVVKIYYTLYCYYRANFTENNGGKSNFARCCRILSVIEHPTSSFVLKYLILPHNYLVPLSEVPQAKFYFQMDTIVLVNDFAPIVSFLSNIAEVDWCLNGQSRLEELNEEFKKLISGEK